MAERGLAERLSLGPVPRDCRSARGSPASPRSRWWGLELSEATPNLATRQFVEPRTGAHVPRLVVEGHDSKSRTVGELLGEPARCFNVRSKFPAGDIDKVTKTSFGLRMPIVGLVKRFDFAGLDLSQKVLRNRQYEPPQGMDRSPSIDRLVSQGKLGVKTGGGFYEYGGRSTEEIMRERDIKLIKLREFLKDLGEMPE